MNPSDHGQPAEGDSGPGSIADVAERARSGEIVVHPSTGVVLGDARALELQPPQLLAEAFTVIDEQMSRLRQMRKLLDHELARRLDEKDRKRFTWGDYEVSLEGRRESVWDADELERTVRGLIDQGIVNAGEVTDLIRHETTVSRSAGARLIDRLSGEPRKAIEACRTWQTAGRRRLDVVRSIQLFPDRRT